MFESLRFYCNDKTNAAYETASKEQSQERNRLRKVSRTGPEGIKLFLMLTSAGHEICPAAKSQNTNNCKLFLAKNIGEHDIFFSNKYENADIT